MSEGSLEPETAKIEATTLNLEDSNVCNACFHRSLKASSIKIESTIRWGCRDSLDHVLLNDSQ